MTAYMEHKDLSNVSISEKRIWEIADGVHRVMEEIDRASAAAGRHPDDVTLLAATKTRDVGEIMAAIAAGVRMIGENRPQEVVAKAEGLRRFCARRGLWLGRADDGMALAGGAAPAGDGASVSNGSVSNGSRAGDVNTAADVNAAAIAAAQEGHLRRVPFHLIGQLQANKIGKVLPFVDTVESVDSLESAERLNRRAQARGIVVDAFLEVNESGEAAKSGCSPQEAIDLAMRIAALGSVRLTGLMTVGAHVDDEHVIRAGFAHLRSIRDAVVSSGEQGTGSCCELSMGMTHDLGMAIAEGSTIVRVGTAIFGPRAFV